MVKSTPIIELHNIKKVYGKGNSAVNALRNINICIEKGEMISIMGPSGSGKSSLLNIIGLLDDATDGSYKLYGNPAETLSSSDKAVLRNTTFGFVVQDFALIEKYTVLQNIEIPFAYLNKRITKKEKKERIHNVLKLLGIEEKNMS